MEKRVFCQLNGNRKVIGILRGYDVRPIAYSRPDIIGSQQLRCSTFFAICLFDSDAAFHNTHVTQERQG